MRRLRLTRDERSAVFRGDDRALRRSRRPKTEPGEVHILASTRGGRQVVDRETGATVEIPRKPTVWIEIHQVELRRGEWLVRFGIHDERQPLRRLAPTPGPYSEPSLKTRLRKPRSERGEPWTAETERGYGAGRAAIDPLEAVDDATLAVFATQARQNRLAFRAAIAAEDEAVIEELRRRRERAIRDRLRETLSNLQPDAQTELLAAIEREIVQAETGFDAAA